jgi:hypothetical protein
MYISNEENEALKRERKYKPKYIKLCTDMLGSIEAGTIQLLDGGYYIKGCEISFCPFCGKELLNYEKVAMGDIESEER